MERENYVNPKQDEAFAQYEDGVLFQEAIEKIYEEIDYKMKLPDFLGKTVRITKRQFPAVFKMIQDIAEIAEIEVVPVYVYEDYFYGAESYGINQAWIELSAKTVQDFSSEELAFVLGREIYKIKDSVAKHKTLMEEYFKIIHRTAPDEVEKVSKLSFNQWYRFANYTADNYGYLVCGNIKSSIQAILKMVLNSKPLAEQVNIREFLGQASEINKLDDMTFTYTKADESVPYAPHRIQNLLAYAVSDRGMSARKRISERKIV